MPHIPSDTNVDTWHKYFAVEANNRAWELSVCVRSPEEDLEMLNSAHSSAFHWSKVGTQLHRMRATMLLAEVHALLGFGESAYDYAVDMLRFFSANDSPDWEIAFAHAIHAHACHVAARFEEYERSYANALKSIEMISDPEDRKIVLQTFEQIAKQKIKEAE